MESDPLDGLLNTLAKLPNEAGAAVQIILRSSHKKWHRRGQAVAREMQQGKSLSEASRKDLVRPDSHVSIMPRRYFCISKSSYTLF